MGGNLSRAPYYNRNLNIGPRIDSNLGQSPYAHEGRGFRDVAAYDETFRGMYDSKADHSEAMTKKKATIVRPRGSSFTVCINIAALTIASVTSPVTSSSWM